MSSRVSWADAFEQVQQSIFRISTQNGYGSGFLLHANLDIYGIATAYHVISKAHDWELPIRVTPSIAYPNSQPAFLQAETTEQDTGRFIIKLPTNDDSALIMCGQEQFPNTLKLKPLELLPEGLFMRPGDEVAWAGYPCLPTDRPYKCSFFSGRISRHDRTRNEYCVDGTIINGVSGGPVFTILEDKVYVVGIATAYWPNRSTGESEPGLGIVLDASPLQKKVKYVKSFDDFLEDGNKQA